jgi:hypothetical protein
MSEAQHVGEFQEASDGSNDGNVFKDGSAFQSIRNQLADSDEAHIGIYAHYGTHRCILLTAYCQPQQS